MNKLCVPYIHKCKTTSAPRVHFVLWYFMQVYSSVSPFRVSGVPLQWWKAKVFYSNHYEPIEVFLTVEVIDRMK